MNLRTAFATGRIAIGASAWLSPTVTGRVFGLGNIGSDPRVALVARLFGVRDVVLGAALLAARDDATTRSLIRAAVVIDTVDAAAALLGRRAGLGLPALTLLGGGAVSFAAVGAKLLQRDHALQGAAGATG